MRICIDQGEKLEGGWVIKRWYSIWNSGCYDAEYRGQEEYMKQEKFRLQIALSILLLKRKQI